MSPKSQVHIGSMLPYGQDTARAVAGRKSAAADAVATPKAIAVARLRNFLLSMTRVSLSPERSTKVMLRPLFQR